MKSQAVGGLRGFPPPGFTTQLRVCKSRRYNLYFSPSGASFRSAKQAWRSIEQHDPSPPFTPAPSQRISLHDSSPGFKLLSEQLTHVADISHLLSKVRNFFARSPPFFRRLYTRDKCYLCPECVLFVPRCIFVHFCAFMWSRMHA